MHFIAILVALFVERLTHFGKMIRSYELFTAYFNVCEKILAKMKLAPILSIAAILLPAVLVMGILYGVLLLSLFGILGFAFFMVVLLYCLGDDDFSQEKANEIFLKAHKNVFSVIFWGIIFGPAGAVLYRLNNELIKYYQTVPEMANQAKKLEQLLEWIPVRLETFAYALMGNFTQTLTTWIQTVFTHPEQNDTVLIQCAQVAMDKRTSPNEARALVDRTLVVWLVVMALIVLL